MIFTDTHAHLYDEAFDNDRAEMMQKAINNKVERFFIPAVDSATTQKMYDLGDKYPLNVHLMMGLHPTSVKPESYLQELNHVENELKKRAFCGVGEIGIDLYWDKSTLGIQQEAFHRQIILAKDYNLPIAIHCREAFDEVFEVLEAHKGDGLKGIFHCFTGNLEQARKAISYNLHLGIGGVVTFKNGKIDQFLNQVDLKNLVLETDAPYLSPTPFRGKRNESSYIPLIAKKLSEIYKVSIEEIAEITTQNANAIFNIKKHVTV